MSRVDGALREQRGPEEEAVWAQQQRLLLTERPRSRSARWSFRTSSITSRRQPVAQSRPRPAGAEAVAVHGRSHEALLWSSQSAAPAEFTQRSATLTLATPAVSHTERPVTMAAGRPESAETGWQRGGSSDAPAEPRQRVHEGATARRSHERCSGALPWLSSPTI